MGFPWVAEKVPLNVCTTTWVPFGSFQIREIQWIWRRVKLETPSSKEEESLWRSHTPLALFLFLDRPGFCSEDRQVLRSSDNSGLWLLAACMYNHVAADLEYSLKLGIHIFDIRTPARLWMDQTERIALFSWCWEQTQCILCSSMAKGNTGHINDTLRWKKGSVQTMPILLSWLYLTNRAQEVTICPFCIPNIQPWHL